MDANKSGPDEQKAKLMRKLPSWQESSSHRSLPKERTGGIRGPSGRGGEEGGHEVEATEEQQQSRFSPGTAMKGKGLKQKPKGGGTF